MRSTVGASVRLVPSADVCSRNGECSGMMVVMECKCGEVGWVRCRWNEMGWCVGRLERTWASVERFCSAIKSRQL
ncbi:unnamed protein product [Microthlaspi erraticum]|uniref:Uncharacterized protein n=2 Tax=Microthlaspi erraticum TaxID=1685480 RepID=A0A6D2JR99_9BRAS|nr:unnamed protein product [Microthlaspi erraticum]CAA7046033.1 unnamed protein product [Microthlaspi erraticum]